MTASLASGDVEAATEAKSRLEQAQREGERARAAAQQHFPWRYFRKEGESSWVSAIISNDLLGTDESVPVVLPCLPSSQQRLWDASCHIYSVSAFVGGVLLSEFSSVSL